MAKRNLQTAKRYYVEAKEPFRREPFYYPQETNLCHKLKSNFEVVN
jgi:fructose-1,6-bisphosphatase